MNVLITLRRGHLLSRTLLSGHTEEEIGDAIIKMYIRYGGRWTEGVFNSAPPFKFVEAAKFLVTQPKWDSEGDGMSMRHLDRRQSVQMEVSMELIDGTSSIVDLHSGGIYVEVDRGSYIVATGVT